MIFISKKKIEKCSFPLPWYQNVPLSLALSPRIISAVAQFKPDIIHASSPGIMVGLQFLYLFLSACFRNFSIIYFKVKINFMKNLLSVASGARIDSDERNVNLTILLTPGLYRLNLSISNTG